MTLARARKAINDDKAVLVYIRALGRIYNNNAIKRHLETTEPFFLFFLFFGQHINLRLHYNNTNAKKMNVPRERESRLCV